MATGLIRTLRWERDFDAANIVTLTNEGIIPGAKTLVERVTQCMFHPHRKLRNEEFLFKENELWVARVTGSARTTRFLKMKDGIDEAPPQILEENQSLRLTIKSPGLLDRLVFEGEPIWYQALGSHDVELRIHAAGVNFKDVMIAMGQMAQKSIGLEGAGEVIRIGPSVRNVAVGDRVVCFVFEKERGCFQTLFRTNEASVVKMPAESGQMMQRPFQWCS